MATNSYLCNNVLIDQMISSLIMITVVVSPFLLSKILLDFLLHTYYTCKKGLHSALVLLLTQDKASLPPTSENGYFDDRNADGKPMGMEWQLPDRFLCKDLASPYTSVNWHLYWLRKYLLSKLQSRCQTFKVILKDIKFKTKGHSRNCDRERMFGDLLDWKICGHFTTSDFSSGIKRKPNSLTAILHISIASELVKASPVHSRFDFSLPRNCLIPQCVAPSSNIGTFHDHPNYTTMNGKVQELSVTFEGLLTTKNGVRSCKDAFTESPLGELDCYTQASKKNSLDDSDDFIVFYDLTGEVCLDKCSFHGDFDTELSEGSDREDSGEEDDGNMSDSDTEDIPACSRYGSPSRAKSYGHSDSETESDGSWDEVSADEEDDASSSAGSLSEQEYSDSNTEDEDCSDEEDKSVPDDAETSLGEVKTHLQADKVPECLRESFKGLLGDRTSGVCNLDLSSPRTGTTVSFLFDEPRRRMACDISVTSFRSCLGETIHVPVMDTAFIHDHKSVADRSPIPCTTASCQTEKVDISKKKKSVSFAPQQDLATVHQIIAWDYAYRAARKGPWEKFALDRCHFRRKIQGLKPILEPVLRKKLAEICK